MLVASPSQWSNFPLHGQFFPLLAAQKQDNSVYAGVFYPHTHYTSIIFELRDYTVVLRKFVWISGWFFVQSKEINPVSTPNIGHKAIWCERYVFKRILSLSLLLWTGMETVLHYLLALPFLGRLDHVAHLSWIYAVQDT